MSNALRDDPRWRRTWDTPWVCPICSEKHLGICDLACGKPDPYPGSEDKASNSALDLKHDFLSEDFCVLGGQHFFVRAVIELKILDSAEKTFGFGVWATLSEVNFTRYVGTFDSGEQNSLGPWFGWFSNRLQGYPDTLNLKCQVHLRGGKARQRPWIELESTDHPLAIEQREGITFDRLLEIYAINGHDIKSALCN